MRIVPVLLDTVHMGVRDDLVRAGGELLERDGLAALTLRRIARQAGVSHGAPRHHFPTYADLLAAIARTGIDDLDTELAPLREEADPREALRAAFRRVVDFAARRPEMFELISRHDLLAGAGGDLRPTTGGWLDSLSCRLRELRPDAGPAHALALWSGVQGLAVMMSRRGADAVSSEAVDPHAVIDVLVAELAG